MGLNAAGVALLTSTSDEYIEDLSSTRIAGIQPQRAQERKRSSAAAEAASLGFRDERWQRLSSAIHRPTIHFPRTLYHCVLHGGQRGHPSHRATAARARRRIPRVQAGAH